ncbi:MAG: hypothetical protein H7Y31_06720 [Chitinophagaceae bacterium]|nr:hypothetical protein [Chitinophagaceae bacterium]
MKKILLSSLCVMCIMTGWAQYKKETKSKKDEKREARRDKINLLMKQEEEGELVFNKHHIFGFKMISDGYGLSYEFGKYKSNRKTTLFQFEFNEKRHPKEKKISLFDGFGFSNVVFGKTNNFYQAKLGIAQQLRVGGKANKNGVAVSAIVGGGLSAGLLKPYYVKVVDQNNVNEEFQSTFPTIIDSVYGINGAAGIFTGWGEVKFNPGAHAKAAMRFDYGRFNENVTAIEVGLMAEYYSKDVSQLAYVKQKQFFFSGYISILLGRRK